MEAMNNIVKKYWTFIEHRLHVISYRPTYATPAVLERSGLNMSDIDVFEYHEAFATRKDKQQRMSTAKLSRGFYTKKEVDSIAKPDA